jgi:chaperonin GroES
MSKSLQPQNDRVLIKPVESGEEMYGNIIIPDMGKEKPEMGEVIAVGPGRQSEFGHFIRVNAKVGDFVLIPKIGSLRIDFEGQEYFLTPDREILAIVLESQDNE